jgi:hypothetical protein
MAFGDCFADVVESDDKQWDANRILHRDGYDRAFGKTGVVEGTSNLQTK